MKKKNAGVISAIVTFGPALSKFIINKIDDKKKAREEELKRDKMYNDKKQNGLIKILSMLLLLFSTFFTIISIKKSRFALVFVGFLCIVFLGYTYLLCLEVLKEKKKNVYCISFVIGCMLLIALITFLFL